MLKKIVILLFILISINLNAKDMSKYDKYVNFEYGFGSNKLYLFITPGCSHCDKLIKKIKLFPELNTYKFFLIPMNHIGNSNDKVKSILSEKKKDRFKKLLVSEHIQYKNYKGNDTKEILETIKRNKIIFESNNGKYVPYILNKNGNSINTYGSEFSNYSNIF